MNNFLPDMGMALKNNTFPMPNLKTITLTTLSMTGNPIRSMGNTCEINHEVSGYLATFRLPISSSTFSKLLKKRGAVTLIIDKPLKTEVCTHGQEFAPIKCKLG